MPVIDSAFRILCDKVSNDIFMNRDPREYAEVMTWFGQEADNSILVADCWDESMLGIQHATGLFSRRIDELITSFIE